MIDVMEYFGLNDAKTVELDDTYTDNHVSEVGLGYRTIAYNGQIKNVIAVIVRGTNGTIEEWSSNFDIGDGSDDRITIKNRGTTEEKRDKAIKKIPSKALPFCIIKPYDGGEYMGWDFDVCQTPAYFMQLIAAVMGKEIGRARFVVELNIAKRYEKAKRGIERSTVGKIEHPHYVESYYVLAKNISSLEF